jgi:hypothetical protein
MPFLRRVVASAASGPFLLAGLLLVLLWAGLLAAVTLWPYATHSATLVDDLVRNTVRVSLLYYAAAASLMLLLHPGAWRASAGLGWLARLCWTLAWAAFLVHLFMAFHHYHHWSHADAIAHTRQVSGFGAGIYVSHLFFLLWSADVLSWWLAPSWYAGRPALIDYFLHAFMVFVIFNATIVYEAGFIRWAAVALFAELAILGLYRWFRAPKD